MAIAYFIPDQSKLLAGRRQDREAANNQRNSSASQTAANNQSARNPPETNSSPAAVNRGYGTTINVTVPTSNNSAEATGCWDFLTQVFCHALRFYHESSQIQPTVIQISVNFQTQTEENNNGAASSAEATENPAAQENSNIATATAATEMDQSPLTAANNPSARNSRRGEKPTKPKTSGKRKN